MEEAEAQDRESARLKEVELEKFKAFKGYTTLNQLNTSLEKNGTESSENSKAYGRGTTEAIRNHLKATFDSPAFTEWQQIIEGARTSHPRWGKPAVPICRRWKVKAK